MKDYERTGVLSAHDIHMPSENCLDKGVAIIECVQEIPCNPCVDVCPFDAISMESINAPPIVDYEKCTGCAQCVAICPGLAIFVVKTEGKRDRLTIIGSSPKGSAIESYDDHRIAMAFSILGSIAGDTIINDAKCVSKTFPQFWDVFQSIGGKVELDGK